MGMKSDNFCPSWFLEQMDKSENIYRDFKELLYKVGKNHDEENFNFIKDIIAFSNIARSTGKSCHILFGIRDFNREVIDTSGQHPFFDDCCPQWLTNVNLNIATKEEQILAHYRNIIKAWINPDPIINLEYGVVEDKFVSYLEVKPTYTKEHFCLKKDFKGSKGKIYIRKGSSTEEITSEEAKTLFPATEVKYLSFSELKEIATNHCSGDFEKAATIIPPFDVKSQKTRRAAQEDIESEIEKNREKIVVVVIGSAGEGKTILLQRITYRIARSLLSYLESIRPEERDDLIFLRKKNIPKVPIYISLRTYIDTKKCIDNLIISEFSNIGIRVDSINQLFKIPNSHWIILFDGIDELRNASKAGAVLRSWISELPNNIQVILTSRPGLAEGPAEVVVPIAPLNQEEIEMLITGKLNDLISKTCLEQQIIEAIKNDLKSFLDQNPSIWTILSRNRTIDGFLSYCFESYIIEKPSIDQDKVGILATGSNPPADISENSQSLPEISIEELTEVSSTSESRDEDNQLYEEESENSESRNDDGRLNDIVLPLRLPLAIQKITEYMIEEEIKRQREFGEDSRIIAERATFELTKLAWQLEDIQFSFDDNKKILTKKSRDWNEIIGFIRRRSYPMYAFWCDLLKDFFAALYCVKKGEKEMPSMMKNAKNQKIIEMIIGLFSANGIKIDYNQSEVIQ